MKSCDLCLHPDSPGQSSTGNVLLCNIKILINIKDIKSQKKTNQKNWSHGLWVKPPTGVSVCNATTGHDPAHDSSQADGDNGRRPDPNWEPCLQGHQKQSLEALGGEADEVFRTKIYSAALPEPWGQTKLLMGTALKIHRHNITLCCRAPEIKCRENWCISFLVRTMCCCTRGTGTPGSSCQQVFIP